MAEKTIGSGKTRNEKWIQITLSEKTLHELLENLDEFRDNKFVKLNINIQDAPDQYGKNIKVSRDTWKPSGGYAPRSEPERTNNYRSESEVAEQEPDLPF